MSTRHAASTALSRSQLDVFLRRRLSSLVLACGGDGGSSAVCSQPPGVPKKSTSLFFFPVIYIIISILIEANKRRKGAGYPETAGSSVNTEDVPHYTTLRPQPNWVLLGREGPEAARTSPLAFPSEAGRRTLS